MRFRGHGLFGSRSGGFARPDNLVMLAMVDDDGETRRFRRERGKKVYVFELGRSERENNDRGGVILCCWRFKVGLR